MYASSSPCGDSTVRRWGNNKADPFLCPVASAPSSTSSPVPNPWLESTPHSNMNAQAVKSGQFALLSKGSNASDSPSFVPPPPGTHYPPSPSSPSSPHTCSDKILLRNMIGLQGTLLTTYYPEPIFLTSITIGRKYSNLHSRRALCCRSSSYKTSKNKNPRSFHVNHPVIMGTSVKADESVTDDAGAVFGRECRVGWGGEVEVLDGDTGKLLGSGEVSKVSSAAFATLAVQAAAVAAAATASSSPTSTPPSTSPPSLDELKRMSPGWAEKEELMNNHEFFKMYAWRRRINEQI
ncbi:hypothetical protein TL16_g03461 [Triparma laevis f. inornata]|uniref:A to I editase domain-containing protein n=1 Tax=Triparma laevis f. inornata TaxID=1714386 RepID=A0A9W6ZXT0_9STRA|nr:hypothetical protein TL16_g03461 [Triparma laevis f. inornata]